MKDRSPFTALPSRMFLLSGALIILAILIGGMLSIASAQATGTPIAPTASSAPAAASTIDPVEAMNQAQLALTQVQTALTQIQAVASQSAQVSSQAGVVLNFIQVVAILGSVLGAVAGLLFTVNGLRTLNEYQGDLVKSREALGQMRAEMEAATVRAAQTSKGLEEENARQVQLVKDESVKAYRSLGLLQVGEQQYELGNHKAALQMYEEAYQLNPNNEIVNYFLGELYLIERDLPEAVKYLERAIKLGENMSPAYAALGLARRLQADSDKQITPEQRNRQYAEAEQLLLRAVELNPGVRDINKESAFTTLGALYKREGRLDDALTYYKRAAQVTPNSTYPLVNVAQLYYTRGDLTQAREYYSRVLDVAIPKLTMTPHDIWLRLDVITAELATGQIDAANKNIDAMLGQSPSLGHLETGLSGLHMLKNVATPPAGIDEAIMRFQTAIQNHHTPLPDHADQPTGQVSPPAPTPAVPTGSP